MTKLSVIIFLMLISHQVFAKSRTRQIADYKGTSYFGHFQELPTVSFCILYDGELIELDEACFTIKDAMLGVVNLLFVDPEKIKFATEGNNTVCNLILDTKDYKFYQLEITQLPANNVLSDGAVVNDYVSSWHICEKIINDSLPLNTIVVPLNPNHLEIKLENVTGKPNNLAIRLPEIKLTSKCDKTIKELMIEGYLKTIALKPFHTKQRAKCDIKNGTKISMIL